MNTFHVDDTGHIVLAVDTSFSELNNFLKNEAESGNEEPVAILMSELGEMMGPEDEMDEDLQKNRIFVEEFIQNLSDGSNMKVIDFMVKHKWIDAARPTTQEDTIEIALPLKFS